jgi:LCP family protein required for cell wall assembly
MDPRERLPRPRRARRIWRVLGALVLVVVLLLAGYAGYLYWDLSNGVNTSNAIGAGAARSTDGSANILLIGLDSRKDQNGNQLPKEVLDQLHAGDGNQGGYNTNTLILMHVPSNGGKVTAFSIPRDDFVTYVDAPYGQKQGKIKEAYGLAKAAKEEHLAKQGVKDRADLEKQGREAARTSTLANVRNLTGVPIDHVAEVNLAGFFDLATALGGVDVCLNHPVQDDYYSGANFPAGRQTLNGAQALAFVRQRHGLANGDLDRTHRQQAFLSSASHKLLSVGTLLNPFQVQRVIDVAKKDVVVDADWGLWGFAQHATDFSGGNMEFQTLPIKGFSQVNGQSVNLIDAAQIKQIVQTTFAGTASSSGAGQPTGAGQQAPQTGVHAAPAGPATGQNPTPAGPQGKPVDGGGIPCVD